MDPAVCEAIKKSAAVPSMPQVVARFLEAIADPNFKYDEVVRILSTDPGTVAEVLRLANSALFGLSRKVTYLKQALTLLGPKRTRSLVLGRYLVAGVSGRMGGLIDTGYFWRRSLASGVLAARLADQVMPKQRDEVFISALLADIGVPILAQVIPDRYRPMAVRYAPHAAMFDECEEREAVGATHGEVSAMVLAAWSLPESVCEAVAAHHRDDLTPAHDASRVALILNGADRIARLLCEIPDVQHAGRTCADVARLVGVDLAAVGCILGEIERDVEELASILHIQVIPSHVYALIAQSVQGVLTGV